MKINFDCADDCKHKGVCKYVDDMNKLELLITNSFTGKRF